MLFRRLTGYIEVPIGRCKCNLRYIGRCKKCGGSTIIRDGPHVTCLMSVHITVCPGIVVNYMAHQSFLCLGNHPELYRRPVHIRLKPSGRHIRASREAPHPRVHQHCNRMGRPRFVQLRSPPHPHISSMEERWGNEDEEDGKEGIHRT